MSTGFFGDQPPIRYEGPESRNPLAFRFYDPDRIVLGKRMEDHLRFAVCYWHNFAWPGTDPFGGSDVPHGPGSATAWTRRRLKADVAFEMFEIARRSLLRLPRPRHRAGRRTPRGIEPQCARDRRSLCREDADGEGQAAVGDGQPLLQPPLHGRRRHQSRSRCVRLCRRSGEERARRHPSTRRRKLRAVGWPGRLRDASQYRHEARARAVRALPDHGGGLQGQDRL